MKITKEWLKKHKACKDQIKTFAEEWPEGAEITLQNCLRGGELGLNIEWLVFKILPKEPLARYEAERAEASARYQAETEEAWARYEFEMASPSARYEAEAAEPWAWAEKAEASARYEAERAEASARYLAEAAGIFFKIMKGNDALLK